MDNYKYSLNKRCSACGNLIKKDTICNKCYKKLEEITFEGRKDIEPIYCQRCGLLIGFSDMKDKVGRKHCNDCFILRSLNK